MKKKPRMVQTTRRDSVLLVKRIAASMAAAGLTRIPPVPRHITQFVLIQSDAGIERRVAAVG